MDTNNKLREMVIAKMQSGDFDLKPCPFCGGKPTMMDKQRFDFLQSDGGIACITVACKTCGLMFYEHTHDEHDYYIRAFMIAEKWNRRIDKC